MQDGTPPNTVFSSRDVERSAQTNLNSACSRQNFALQRVSPCKGCPSTLVVSANLRTGRRFVVFYYISTAQNTALFMTLTMKTTFPQIRRTRLWRCIVTRQPYVLRGTLSLIWSI